ncbi:MAG: hypothetical protein NXH82_03690 [Rhodobacteraceae bacterium]|nr:hypothetical protein [Paracoccaceae bacterium]
MAAQNPLSVIDWLSQNPTPAPGQPVEPPVASSGSLPQITVAPLEQARPPVGLVPSALTGLPPDLWQRSARSVVARLIRDVPVDRTPAMQALLYRLLLTEAEQDPEDVLLTARVERLLSQGAVDPAQALLDQAGPTHTPALFAKWFDASLLTGTEDTACAQMRAEPRLAPDIAAQIFCTARGNAVGAASVMFDGANALGLMPSDTADLLDRFLHPEAFDDAPPPAAPRAPTALTFRLSESVGAPLPTTALARRFASADLRDIAGWRAQIEAAERLARAGAIAPNLLLGLYTSRLPAASGGIWDRVAALQRFDAALTAGDTAAVVQRLPQVWEAMQRAGIGAVFAELFAEPLLRLDLDDPDAAMLVYEIALISPLYETAAQTPPRGTIRALYLAALAQGRPLEVRLPDATAVAIATGFGPAILPEGLTAERLGESILRLIALFDMGARGNLQALTDAISGLRALGLEDTARRAALQHVLLKAEPL